VPADFVQATPQKIAGKMPAPRMYPLKLDTAKKIDRGGCGT